MSGGRLQGRRCLVTGAASGIGRETARRFAAEGARVIATDRDAARLDELGLTVEHVAVLDVTDPEQWRTTVSGTVAKLGGLDVLVHCAGVLLAEDTGVETTDLDVWDTTLRVNAGGTFLAARHVVPVMSDGGSIVTMSSIAATLGSGSGAAIAYAASRGAVSSMTKVLAASLGARGIRCNAVAPAVVETPMVADAYDAAATDRRLDRMPAGRLGRPADIAALVVYLASDESSWTTGAVLPIDGGASAFYV